MHKTKTTENTYLHKMCGRQANTIRGVSLVDVVAGVALFALVVLSLIGAFRLGIEVIGESKARVGALALATEQIEFIRSLDYADVGISGGSPAGLLPAQETVTLNGISYTRNAGVSYVDDEKDGTGGSDADGNTDDYKKVEIEVTWNIRGIDKSMSITTNVAQ